MYNKSQTNLYNVLMGNPVSFGSLTAIPVNELRGTGQAESTPIDFIKKRLGSIGNAIGTTFSSLVSPFKDAAETTTTEQLLKDQKQSLNDIAKKYGYDSQNAYWDARDAAEQAGDTAKLAEMDSTIGEELKAKAQSNSDEMKAKSERYKDYRENNLLSKNINQDRGKFAGSAINTLSTGFDIASMAAGIPNGPGINAIQGGIEGFADELEQNGLENFSGERALKNFAVGATAGAATGALNKAIGGRSLVPAKSGLGGVAGKVLGTGIGRGALSGAVGGAVGAGTSAALNGQDVLGSALEGAKQGATQGAVAGGLIGGVNRLTNSALNRFAPETAQKMQQNAQAWDNWKNSGENFNERLTNTLNSGDSAVGDWLNRKTQSGVLGNAGNLGNRVQTVDAATRQPDAWDRLAQQNGYETYDDVIESYMRANPGVELNPNGAAGQILTWLDENPKTPTTAGGWLKRAGQRAVEDINNTNLGNRIEAVDGDALSRAKADTWEPERLNGTYIKNKLKSYGIDTDGLKISRQRGGTSDAWYVDGDSGKTDLKAVENILRNKLESYDTDAATGEILAGGNTFVFVNDNAPRSVGVDTIGRRTEYSPAEVRQLIQEYDNYTPPKTLSGNSFDEVSEVVGPAGGKLLDIYKTMNGGVEVDPYNRQSWSNFESWLDSQRTKTPTTTSGWLKQAGKRIVDDVNNTNLGNRIQNVNELPEDVRNMRINDNMANVSEEYEPGQPLTAKMPSRETEVYRALANEPEPISRALGEQSVQQPETIETKFTKKTSREAQLRNAAGLKLQQQYGTIDKPTAKATNAPETLRKIAEAGFTKPADVERMADAITGSNGEASKLVANLVKTAKPINTFDGETSGQTLKDYIDLSVSKNGLDGIREGKAVRSQIDALMKSLPSHAEGSIDFVDDPTDVFKLTQQLDAEAANYEGRSGMNYGTTTPDKMRAAKVIKDVSNLLKDKIYSSADVKTALTPEVAENFKAYDPNNKAWADYVDKEIMGAKTIADLRSMQAPWVRAKKIIDNGYLNSVTYGGRVGNNNGLPLTPNGLKTAALNATINSKPGLRAQAKILDKAADVTASIEGSRGAQSTGTNVNTPVAEPTSQRIPSQAIWNQIGRGEGNAQGEQARTARYLADAVNTTDTANATTLEGLLAPNAGSTSVYDTMYGTSQPTTELAQAQAQQTPSYFPTTGDYLIDILGTALTSAINADDADAFASLYSMYQDAVAQAQKKSTSSTANQQKLTATQQRANAAMNSLQRLSNMTPDLGYNLSSIPVIGDIATFGGNDYEGEAKSLAQQIGYMVSGANIKEEEAYNIGKAYVPQPFDSEQTRQNKLRRAYEIIQQYQNGMAEE